MINVLVIALIIFTVANLATVAWRHGYKCGQEDATYRELPY